MASDSDDPPEPHPIVNKLIEESLAPYRGLMSDEWLADMAAVLDLFLTTDPRAVGELKRLGPSVVTSGVVDRSGAPVPADGAPKKLAGGNG